MEVVHQLRAQILDQLRKSGFVRSFTELNVNASNWVAVKACILSGLYPQVARSCSSGKLSTRYESSVRLHKTSTIVGDDSKASQKKAIANLPSEWMIYEEISRLNLYTIIRIIRLMMALRTGTEVMLLHYGALLSSALWFWQSLEAIAAYLRTLLRTCYIRSVKKIQVVTTTTTKKKTMMTMSGLVSIN